MITPHKHIFYSNSCCTPLLLCLIFTWWWNTVAEKEADAQQTRCSCPCCVFTVIPASSLFPCNLLPSSLSVLCALSPCVLHTHACRRCDFFSFCYKWIKVNSGALLGVNAHLGSKTYIWVCCRLMQINQKQRPCFCILFHFFPFFLQVADVLSRPIWACGVYFWSLSLPIPLFLSPWLTVNTWQWF